jgi:hypothetical protein
VDSELIATSGTQQVGDAVFNGIAHAGLWSGTAGSWEDLSLALPGGPSSWHNTQARSIWSDANTLYIAGDGFNVAAGQDEALLWTRPVPAPGTGVLFGLGGLVFTRRRR